MGTRYEDQPAEHWAGAESLDPTPVWKQYILIALLLFGGLIAVVVVSLLAIAPQIVTPPALVPGDRLVLAIGDLPAVGASPKLIGPPLIDEGRSFLLAQPERGVYVALRARWSPRAGEEECRLGVIGGLLGKYNISTSCSTGGPAQGTPIFDQHGVPMTANASRGLDQYLVSVGDDRVIVNLSRLIEASERTGGPVPTGIPQPQAP
jgi:hypothetical protein